MKKLYQYLKEGLLDIDDDDDIDSNKVVITAWLGQHGFNGDFDLINDEIVFNKYTDVRISVTDPVPDFIRFAPSSNLAMHVMCWEDTNSLKFIESLPDHLGNLIIEFCDKSGDNFEVAEDKTVTYRGKIDNVLSIIGTDTLARFNFSEATCDIYSHDLTGVAGEAFAKHKRFTESKFPTCKKCELEEGIIYVFHDSGLPVPIKADICEIVM